MLTASGDIKVLDFGLARGGAPTPVSGDPGLSASPTMTYAASMAGVILGTAAYMSPEQARGRTVDRRTDIWSFGCVLYECLTGRTLFAGETVSDMIAKILEREPDWSALPARTPNRVRDLLVAALKRIRRNGSGTRGISGWNWTRCLRRVSPPAARSRFRPQSVCGLPVCCRFPGSSPRGRSSSPHWQSSGRDSRRAPQFPSRFGH